MTNLRADTDDDTASWPYAAMLGFGYFGAGTPEGRRHRNRTYLCLALFTVGACAAGIFWVPWAVRVLGAIAMPVAWAGIVWSYVRYLSDLDELSRLIQLEAAALAYGAIIVLASGVTALGALGHVGHASIGQQVDGWHIGPIPPIMALTYVLFAELLRGVALVLLARRRR